MDAVAIGLAAGFLFYAFGFILGSVLALFRRASE